MTATALDTALQDAVARYVAANPQSKEHHVRAARVLPGGNTRSSIFSHPFPIVLTGGRGARLTSLDGREYLDFLGEYTAGLYGHSNPVIAAAIHQALTDGWALGGQSRLEEQLASLICGRFESVERVRFTNSGTEANLMALAAARAVSRRSRIVVFRGGYHGSLLAFGTKPSGVNAPYDCVVASYNDRSATEQLLQANAADIGAVLVEAMQGSAGCIPGDKEFLHYLNTWCDTHGAVFILDEVMTSRLGPGGLQALYGLSPALTTFGKYLGGGLTFGAFGGRAAIMDRFDPSRSDALLHAGTFNNNVLSLSAGIAGLTGVFTPQAATRLSALGEHVRSELNGIARRAGVAMQFTGYGSMMNAHFCSGAIRSVEDLRSIDPRRSALFYLDLIEAGIWLAPRGMINLSLPMGNLEIECLVAAVSGFIQRRSHLLAAA